jgi:hypothetical protein
MCGNDAPVERSICDIRHAMEHVLELALQELGNPMRPQVAHLTLVEPAEHQLPICAHGKTNYFLGFYDCDLIFAQNQPASIR